MLVTADEVGRSLKGAVDLLNRRTEGLRAFDFSEAGFWHSFQAIWLTLPSYIVTLALERRRLGITDAGRSLLDDAGVAALVGVAQIAAFAALPAAMIWIARKLRLQARYVPFVVVTNWISVVGINVLSVPAILLLLGWATPGLALLFTIAFASIMVRLQWLATTATLGVSGGLAAAIVALGLALNMGVAAALQALLSASVQ